MKQSFKVLQKPRLRVILAWIFVLVALLPLGLSPSYGASDGLPRGAYDLPYTRYESENGTRGGAAALRTSTNYAQTNPASEASDQKYVALPSNSSSVSWTMSNSGAGVTLRFTMPDASGGGAGLTGKLNFYVNNTLVKTIDLSSYWSYQYFNLYQHDPTNAPAPLTFMRFDEVHFKLTNKLNVGDVVKIQKDNGDSYEYGVDFIEVEEVPAAIGKPAGYFSVVDYGAIANDGIDDQAAFNQAVAAADAANTGIYIPEGTFTLANCWRVTATNMGIKGAGMWYSNVYYSTNAYFSGGLMSESSGLDISDIYFNTANNIRWENGQYRVYKGFMGTYGTGSKIQRVWVEHFECGMWIGGYDVLPIVNSTNLLISHCRIRNNFADGINLCQGTNNSIIEFCTVRNNGDDGLASWAAKDMTNNVICSNLTFRNNTIENNWRAGSIGIFGGKNHEIHHNLIKDGVAGSGIRFTTEFPGFLFDQNVETKIYENTIISCGTSTDLVDQEKGAIELYSAAGSIINLTFSNNDIINAQRNGLIIGAGTIDNIVFNNLTINGTGLDGQSKSAFAGAYNGGYAVFCFASSGTTTFNNLILSNINAPGGAMTYKGNQGYNLVVNTTPPVSVTGVTVSPTSSTINVGATAQLTPTVSPSNATNKSVNYSSSNTAVATVNASGLVTAVNSGTANITVTTVDQAKTATCAITVGCTVPVTGVTLSPATVSIQPGYTSQLTATVAPSNACNLAVNYSSSNTAVATVDATGKITAVANGTATITATTVNGNKTATCAVTVSCNVPVTGVSLSPTTLSLDKGGKGNLTATVSPSNACNKSINWTSSNTAIATVSNGQVTGVAQGTATITATTVDGAKTATCAVTVSNNVAITRGCVMPYTRYEASSTNMGGGATSQGPSYSTLQLANEASDRKFVSLPSSGSYVQWTVTGTGQNGFNLRYTVPDTKTGTLALYVNGTKVKDITLSSYWAYQYFDISPSTTGVPSNTSGGGTWEARMMFDELHFILPTALNNGDVIKLQKDNNDGAAYGIDFIELEAVPAQITKPAGYLSILDYGAIADDNVDDALAIRKALDLCTPTSGYLGVYIPAGKFINSNGGGSSGNLYVANSNITIQGAGMWYTQIYFPQTSQNSAGFLMNSLTGIHLQDFSLNGETNGRILGNKALNGSLGTNSTIKNLWVEHFETGFWITSMQGSGWNVTDGLVISNCRIRNTYADGVNLCKGTSNTTVDNCNFRNCIDDAMASWSVNYLESVPPVACHGNIFKNNTAENTLRAGGLGFFGGYGHQAYNLLIKDGLGAGIRANTQFPAYPFGTNASEAINIHDVTVIGCGTTKNLWTYRDGAIDLELPTPTQGNGYSLQYINFENIDVLNSQHDAVFIHSYMASENAFVMDNIKFTNVNINGTGVAKTENNGPQYFAANATEKGGYGIYAANYSSSNVFDGWVDFTGTMSNIAYKDTGYWHTNGKFLIRITASGPVTGVTVSPTSLSIASGVTSQLTANVQPFNAGNKSVTWTSSNTAVVTVNASGLVTAVAPGTANITARTVDGGFTAICAVTVTAAVNITATDASAGEGGNVGVFTISAGSLASNLTVNYTISGTATSADYTSSPALSGSITLTSAAPSAAITITPADDSNFEGTETLIVTLSPSANYNLGGSTSATINIADNDNPPCTGSNITQVSSNLTIDGTLDAAWSSAPDVNISNVTLGSMPADYSGKYKAMWNATYLYLFVSVNDATKINDSGTSWWEDDGVEIFIDGDNSKGTAYDGLNDFQLGFRWNDANINIGGTSKTNITGIVKSMVATANGYALEVAIPWTTIGVTPVIANKLGIEVEVDDDDNNGTRDSQVSAFATTSNAWSTPAVFGTGYITSCIVTACTVTGVTMTPATLSIVKGSTSQLNASVTSTGSCANSVTYSSDNIAVATVSSTGLVTAVSAGTANIKATSTDNTTKYATCAVTVTCPAITSVTLNQSTATLNNAGATVQLSATVAPSTACNVAVTWSSSNTAIATVDATGKVTAVANGTATITATSSADATKKATCAVTVSACVPATSITITPTTVSVVKGQTVQFTITVLPSNACDKTYTITSSNTAIATVNSTGLLTGIAAGTSTITVKSTSNAALSATAAVTVTCPAITSVTLNQSTATLNSAGATVQLSATVAPSTACNASVTWTSSNTAAATVDANGKVTAVANGSAVITAKSSADATKIATCNVSVVIGSLSPWTSVDVGSPSLAGSASVSNGVFTVKGSGADVWATADQFQYVYQLISGDFTMTARVTALQNTNTYAKAGIDVRNALTGNAAHAINVLHANNSQDFQYRTTSGGSTTSSGGVTYSLPYWIRVVRAGNVLTAYRSTDGTNWTAANSVTMTLNTSVYVGMLVCSHDNAVLNTSTFDNVSLTQACNIPVTGVTLNQTTMSMGTGATGSLTATVAPSNACNKNVTWTSSNTSVATVNSNGVVIGVGAGTATITVTTQDQNKTASCAVTVTCNAPVTGVTLNSTTLSIVRGNTSQLTATVAPSNACNKNVSWSSNNTAIATVSTSGLVTAVAVGSATITVTTTDGSKIATCAVTITNPTVTYYQIKNRWQNTYLYDAGDRVRYNATASGSTYNWVFEDVSSGVQEIKNVGTGEYMHIENLTGYVQCTARTSGWSSSRWTREDAGSGYFRFKNVWQPSYYFHVENLQSQLQYGTIDASWMSAQWQLIAVAGTATEVSHENNSTISFMPNPVIDQLKIDLNGNSFETVRIYDLAGRLQSTATIDANESSVMIDASNLKSGMYVVRLISGQNTETFKFVKK